jgi:hypothetical protein
MNDTKQMGSRDGDEERKKERKEGRKNIAAESISLSKWSSRPSLVVSLPPSPILCTPHPHIV